MTSPVIPSSASRIFSVGCRAFIALAFLKIVLGACIIEDAYITFRVVDNFVNGFGLRWNIDERVQVYTHPLWMLLHIPFYQVIGNIYWTTILLSALCAGGTWLILARLRTASPFHKAVLVVLPLMLSKTFSHYAFSGLENPLNFLLIAWFIAELFRAPAVNLYRLYFVASLAVCTRIDNLIPLAPALLWALRSRQRPIHFGKMLVSISPVIAWHGFSLFYYGFLFPNTKYAKLNTGIALPDYLWQGWLYTAHFIKYDLLAASLILFGLVRMLGKLSEARQQRFSPSSSATRFFLLGAGCVLNIAYVLYVGGDFMPGRFYSNVLIIAVAGLYLMSDGTLNQARWMLIFVLSVFLIHWRIVLPSVPDMAEQSLNAGIDDQHKYFYSTNGLLSDPDHWIRHEPDYEWVEIGKKLAKEAKNSRRVIWHINAGLIGFYAGPNVIQIDPMALTDPLLARLPTIVTHRWRIGHFWRAIPDGYLYARETGNLSRMDPALAQYYAKLRLVTAGDLWSGERLKTIVGFQLDNYDAWRNDYVRKHPAKSIEESYRNLL